MITTTAVQGLSPLTWWATIPSPLPEEPPIDPNLISPGLLGLAAFVFLIVAVFLLFRSMRKQLSKVNPDLPEAGPTEPEIPIVDQESIDSTPSSVESSAGEGADGGEPPARN